MKKLTLFIQIMCFHLIGISAFGQTPVEANGQLSVVGTKLTNQYGNPIQLRGMSTHGIQWYGWGDCLTESSLDAMAYDWGSDVLRISMYIQEGGYETNPAGFTNQVKTLVKEATERGMYALIDFHQLSPGDPNYNTQNAKTFFAEMANTFKDYNNVIYDICNEPNGVNWNTIRNYAVQVIPVIRAIDSDAVVLVGTHGWSTFGVSGNGNLQDVINNPLPYSNVMYTFHFYAASHGSQYLQRLDAASDVLPVFVTEFGTQNSAGEGSNNFIMSQQYINLMQQKKISWCNWNYSDDNRSGAVWKTGTCSGGPWTTGNLKEAGLWVRDKMLNPADNFPGGGNLSPTVSITAPSNGATFSAGSTISITTNANDPDGTVSSVQFFRGSTSLGTDNSAPFTANITNATAGTYTLTAVATDNKGAKTTSSSITVTVNQVISQGPYNGVIAQLPGTIEAEKYDVGGEGIAYHDNSAGNSGSSFRSEGVDIEPSTNGGYNVGWIQVNEWLEYTVNVATSGSYTISSSVAAIATGGKFRIEMGGQNVTGTINVPNTGGWQNWQTVTVSGVSLTAGQKVMRIYMEANDFNIDNLVFTQGQTNNAPSVAITSPSNGATFTAGTNISIAANASDSDGSVARVEFFRGSTSLGIDNSAPFSANINNAAAGNYTLTAKATDNQGASKTSSPVSITVTTPSNQAPTVNLTAPANNATFTAGNTITISASASDADGSVSLVEFFAGNTKLGQDNSAPYSFNWTNATTGTYQLTARATDNVGATTTSASRTIVIEGSHNDDCSEFAVPAASDWVLRNNWSDQVYGSSTSAGSGAMAITHKQWGNNFLWVIKQTKLTVQAGQTYTVNFDLKDDTDISLSSVDVALGSQIKWDGITVADNLGAVSGFSSSSFTSKSVTFTASQTGSFQLAFKLNWSSQVYTQADLLLRNVSICSQSSGASVAPPTSAMTAQSNPTFEGGSTLRVEDESTVEMVLIVTNGRGEQVYYSEAHTTNEWIHITLTTSGTYVATAYYGGKAETFKIQKY